MTKEQKLMEIIKAVGKLDESKVNYLYNFMQGFSSEEIKTENKNYINSSTLSANMSFRLEADTLDGINKDLAQFQNEMFSNNKGLKFEITEYNVKKNDRNSMHAYTAVIGVYVFLDSETIKAMNEGRLIF